MGDEADVTAEIVGKWAECLVAIAADNFEEGTEEHIQLTTIAQYLSDLAEDWENQDDGVIDKAEDIAEGVIDDIARFFVESEKTVKQGFSHVRMAERAEKLRAWAKDKL
jgi:hemerythrin-like domain-containing protein